MSERSDLSARDAVRLIATREFTTRVRSKTYLGVTLVLAVLVVCVSFAVDLTQSHGGGSTTIGLTPAGASLRAPLQATADSFGTTVDIVQVPDQTAGEQGVRSGSLDVLVLLDGTQVTGVVQRSLDSSMSSALTILAGKVVLDQQVSRLGGDPTTVEQAVGAAQLHVTALLPPKTYKSQNLILGVAVGILIYLSLLTAGQAVAQGVVEEKSSRVVELLLAAVRPWQLMAAKVLGIGLLGLLQVVIIGGAGLGSALWTGDLHLSIAAATGTIVWLVVWFLLGFTAYSLAFAAAAALVSRQEDAQSVVLPVMMFLIAGYVIGISVLPSNPGSGLVAVLSLIPLFAPTLMPMRLAMGNVPAWEAVLSVVLVAALIPGLVSLAGRIYRNAVVRSGARVRLRDALREP